MFPNQFYQPQPQNMPMGFGQTDMRRNPQYRLPYNYAMQMPVLPDFGGGQGGYDRQALMDRLRQIYGQQQGQAPQLSGLPYQPGSVGKIEQGAQLGPQLSGLPYQQNQAPMMQQAPQPVQNPQPNIAQMPNVLGFAAQSRPPAQMRYSSYGMR